MKPKEIIKKSGAIISIDARGFIFIFSVFKTYGCKPGKLPGDIYEENYELEYGSSKLAIQKNALKKYKSYAIVDDLLATGGTVKCVSNLLKKNGKNVTGLLAVIELRELKGRSKFDFPVETSKTL